MRIREELNIFNSNNKILKYVSHWKYHVLRLEDIRIPKKIFTAQKEEEEALGAHS
jgi:hypothetical protein